MCEFKNVCLVLRSGCNYHEIECPKKEKFERLKSEKCPIMVARGGYSDKICDCDLPFIIRAIIPRNVCVVENQCIIAVYFPNIKRKVYGDNLKKLKPEEMNNLASEVRMNIIKMYRGG